MDSIGIGSMGIVSMGMVFIGIGSIGIFICCSMLSMLSMGGSIISMPLFMAMGGCGQFDG